MQANPPAGEPGPAVLVEHDGRGAAFVTLNRAERRNALGAELLGALGGALEALQDDPSLRCIVLRAAGKHFCAGGDIDPSAHQVRSGPTLPELCDRLAAFPKPVVAVVQGACLGGGLALAGSCDIVVALDDASFSLPEVRLGFAAAPLLPCLRRVLGPRQLLRFGLTGERFSADEALQMGVAQLRASAQDSAAVVERLVDSIRLGGPQALARMKALCRMLERDDRAPGLANELQAAFAQMRDSAEGIEGRAAFREKRKPCWYEQAPSP